MERALTSEEIRGAEFNIALRGYDRREVEAFLHDVAAEVAFLKESSQKSYQVVGVELGQLLQESKDLADKLVLDAQSEAATLVQNAATEAAEIRKSAEGYAKELREQVDGEAAVSRAEADQRFAELISQAETRVQELSIAENETRERISALRVELEEVAKTLLQLGADSSPPAETEPSMEAQSDQLDNEDTIPNGAVPAPPLGSA